LIYRRHQAAQPRLPAIRGWELPPARQGRTCRLDHAASRLPSEILRTCSRGHALAGEPGWRRERDPRRRLRRSPDVWRPRAAASAEPLQVHGARAGPRCPRGCSRDSVAGPELALWCGEAAW